MTTLILFATKHGCTEECSQRLQAQLPDKVELKNLKNPGKVNLAQYDTILIGGSIHAGKIQKSVSHFCRDFVEELKSKRVGLFLCCMEEDKTAQRQFETAFPEEIRAHAAAHGLFGGAFDFQKMNFIERKVTSKISGVTSSVSRISEKAIAGFVRDLLRESE